MGAEIMVLISFSCFLLLGKKQISWPPLQHRIMQMAKMCLMKSQNMQGQPQSALDKACGRLASEKAHPVLSDIQLK